MIDEQAVLLTLKTLKDPELGINVVDLGLIYGVEVQQVEQALRQAQGEQQVKITMTLTTMGCPLGPWFLDNVKKTVAEGVGISEDKVEVEITFDPPWTRDMMNEEAIAELGLD